MARPLRLKFPGALYHVTARGNARDAIFLDDEDRRSFVAVLGSVIDRFGWICHAYCLMDNHYHLMVETPSANLSKGARQLNGVYTQRFNRRHRRVGHLLQGRYKAILVERDSYLLELCRYVVLNPVRAGLVRRAGDYRWSSYRATAGMEVRTAVLSTDWVLKQFAATPSRARQRYREFVSQGRGVDSPWSALRGQVLLGNDDFVEKLAPAVRKSSRSQELTKRQRLLHRPTLERLFAKGIKGKRERNVAIRAAFLKHGYTLKEIGVHLSLHYTTISKVVQTEK